MQAGQFENEEGAGSLADAHGRVLADPGIQFELPDSGDVVASQGQGHGRGGPPPQLDPVTPTADPSLPQPPQAPPPSAPDGAPAFGDGMNGLMQVLLWVAAGIALAILLYWLHSFLSDRRRGQPGPKKARGAVPDIWRPGEAQAQVLLDEAELLAGQGRYDEAAHLLLHRSIGEIDAHRPDLVRPALTSRDIAGHPALPPLPAAAFARIAALVERSFFARRPLALGDWEQCRAAYREFAFAEGWQG